MGIPWLNGSSPYLSKYWKIPPYGCAAFVVCLEDVLDERYPQATKVRLVMANLNTHGAASLCETFEPEEARRLARRHSWWHMIRRLAKPGFVSARWATPVTTRPGS